MITISKHRLFNVFAIVAIIFCLAWFGYEVTDELAANVNGAGLLLAALLYVVLLIKRWLYRSQLERATWAELNEVSLPSDWHKAGPVVASNAYRVEVLRAASLESMANAVLLNIKVRRLLSRYLSPQNAEYSLDYIVLGVDLGVNTPHIFIDGRSQNRFGITSEDLWSLTKRLKKSDKLQDLEGDFYRYFNVYARDKRYLSALSIVTPDVMIELRDKGFNFDYEIHDGYLYIIADPRLSSPEQMRAMLSAARACLDELIPQIIKHRYDDTTLALNLSDARLHVWAVIYSIRVLAKRMAKLIFVVFIGLILGGMFRELLGR